MSRLMRAALVGAILALAVAPAAGAAKSTKAAPAKASKAKAKSDATNTSRKLRPGMSANVSVTFSERTGALVVPDEAVFAEGNQSFVFVVTDSNSVDRTPVRLGTRDSMQVEILEGLKAGQRVVRAGHQKLYPGAKVAPVGAGGPGGPAAGGGK